VLLYLACTRIGAIYLPLNTAYRLDEIEYFLGDAEPRLAVVRPEAAAIVAGVAGKTALTTLGENADGELWQRVGAAAPLPALAEMAPDDVAAILYTSGTTGRPKGAMITVGNLASNGLSLRDLWGFRAGDVLLHALPIYHVHGLFVALHCALLSGASALFLPRFDAAQAVALLPQATVFMGVPTMYVRMLGVKALDRAAVRGMRLFVSGSAPLLPETFAAWRERTGMAILERYGMTEAGMITSNQLEGERRGGTVGLPLPGVVVRTVGEDGRPVAAGAPGVLEIKGPNVFKGYWRNPEKTASEFRADGFFITGDIAVIAPDGYVSIVGRAKDLVISGGLNVYPKEVEEVIDSLPGIDESAVFGVPHPDLGEAVVAAVRLKPGAVRPAEGDVIAAVRERLAAFKTPKAVHFVDDLPRNVMGKVQKNELRKRYADQFR
jgi:malonyl-CoA/methylmalonyl-CoA synthetase